MMTSRTTRKPLTFVPMVPIIPEGTKGRATIKHIKVDRHTSMMSALRPGQYCPEGDFVSLTVGGTMFMSDTRMEHRTNMGFLMHAAGHILIAGLGIGMVLIPLLQKPEVTEVTVLELHQDVVDLVLPALQECPQLKPYIHKLKVIVADVYEWQPPKGETWDVIYFDIWADQSTDDLKDMERLHRKYASRLTKGSPYRWMNSWRRDELKARKASEKRRGGWGW